MLKLMRVLLLLLLLLLLLPHPWLHPGPGGVLQPGPVPHPQPHRLLHRHMQACDGARATAGGAAGPAAGVPRAGRAAQRAWAPEPEPQQVRPCLASRWCFFNGDLVNFKLVLRPAGCTKIKQTFQGGRRKTRGISGISVAIGGHN